MVDYSTVRVNYPSIAFFFGHLGSLLESIEGEYLERISFFVGEDYLYTNVLSSLFPLVSHSTKVARSLKMSALQSSDLEMGLSLTDDRVVSRPFLCPPPIKPRTSHVPLWKRTSKESRIGFSSLIL